jgi:RNA polymerase sigma-B factor
MCAAALAPPRQSHPSRAKPRERLVARELEHQLLIRYHREGDLAARGQLAERLLPFARSLAQRYSHADEQSDDLFQVASLGLLKAIDRFDPDRGVKFTSFAAPTILGELKRHFRDSGWAVHVPRDLQERALAVTRQTEALSKQHGRSPTPREVARALRCSVEDVLEAKQAMESYEAASLDAPLTNQDADGDSLIDLIGGDDLSYELVQDREAIGRTWRDLPELDRHVLELRFMYDLTQSEIGKRIGYSQMHVSRLLRRALERLDTSRSAA